MGEKGWKLWQRNNRSWLYSQSTEVAGPESNQEISPGLHLGHKDGKERSLIEETGAL